jgi:glycosyltransferase involved in cell wall biosynthesis
MRIVRSASDAIIVSNKLRTGEAGKALGVSYAQNEIVAFLDSDNVIDDPSWLRKMTHPFSNPEILASEPLYFSRRRKDAFIARYCALIGANDPLTVYLGNHDRYCFFKRQWTEIPVKQHDHGGYLSVKVIGPRVPTFGANGFLILRRLAQPKSTSPYLFDVDLVQDLAKTNGFSIAKVKIGITHLFADNVSGFIRKSYRRIRDYFVYAALGARSYNWNEYPRAKFLKFVLFSVTLLPTLRDTRRGYAALPDSAWLFHPMACLLVLLVYGTSVLGNARSAIRIFKQKNQHTLENPKGSIIDRVIEA